MKKSKSKTTKKPKTTKSINGGFQLDPNSPIPIWQARDYLDQKLSSKKIKWVIFDGKVYAAKNISEIKGEIQWLTHKLDIAAFMVEFNPKTKTLKYVNIPGTPIPMEEGCCDRCEC